MSVFTSELQIVRHVGAGFFGDVFEGRDQVHGRVAVKVLRPFPGESPAEWVVRSESLLKEAQLLQSATRRECRQSAPYCPVEH